MLKKLSLAALVAMGSMSVASATPLTDAIKGVSLNGYLRIRYYYDNIKNGVSAGNDLDYNRWRTNAKLVFGVPVAENMKIVWRVQAQQNFKDKASSNVSASGRTLDNSLFFLNYANNGLVVNLGVVPLDALPYASSDSWSTAHGTGAVALYNAGNGLVVAGGIVDHLFNVAKSVASTGDTPNNVYTAGIIYSNEAFGSAQIWDYKVKDTIKNAFIVMTNLNFLKDQGIGIKADYATSKLDQTGASNHNYYRIALNANVSGVDAKIGYASTNDKKGVIATSQDAKIGMIPMELRYNVANLKDVDVWYGKLGYKVDEKTKVWASYASIDQSKKAGNVDSNEFDIGGGYKFNKKFGVSAYYANLDYNSDAEKAKKNDKQEVRVELKYSF
jgi:hypothetical protein